MGLYMIPSTYIWSWNLISGESYSMYVMEMSPENVGIHEISQGNGNALLINQNQPKSG